MKRFLLLMVLSTAIVNGYSQQLLWAKPHVATLPSSSSITDIATDNSNNTYVTGSFSGTVNFGGTTLTALGFFDLFYAKYDPNGNLLFVKRIGVHNFALQGGGARLTLTTVGGHVYLLVGGLFNSMTGSVITVNFDPNNLSGGLLSSSGNSFTNTPFLAKYDGTNGNFVWVKSIIINSLSVDPSGSIYGLSGTYQTLDKYDLNGSPLWSKPVENVKGITISNNRIYFYGNGRMKILSFQPVLSAAWSDLNYTQGGATGGGDVRSLVVEPVSGDVIWLGTDSTYPYNTIVRRVNIQSSSFTYLWTQVFPNINVSNSNIHINFIQNTTNSANSQFLLTGIFSGTINLNNGHSLTSSISGTNTDPFAARFSASNGNCLWADKNPSNTTNGSVPSPVVSTNSSFIFIANNVYRRTLNADFGGCNSNGLIVNDNSGSSYIAKYDIQGTSTTQSLPVAVTPSAPSVTCGSSVTLTASGAFEYNWSPSTGLSSTTGASVIASPVKTTTYTVTGTQGHCSGTKTVTVTVNPSITITQSVPSICIGESVVLTASGSSGYTWSPSATLSAATGESVTATPTTTTLLNTMYTATGANGCTGTTFVTTRNAVKIKTIAGQGSGGCFGLPITLIAITDGGETISWASTPQDPNYSVTNSLLSVYDPYTFTVTVSGNGCSDNSASVNIDCISDPSDPGSGGSSDPTGPGASARQASSSKLTQQSDLPLITETTAYPNPGRDKVTIAVPWKANKDASVLLFDANGKLFSTTVLKAGESTTELSVINYPEGLYIVHVIRGGSIYAAKLMVYHK